MQSILDTYYLADGLSNTLGYHVREDLFKNLRDAHLDGFGNVKKRPGLAVVCLFTLVSDVSPRHAATHTAKIVNATATFICNDKKTQITLLTLTHFISIYLFE